MNLTPSEPQLEGRTIAVTGAAGGLGRVASSIFASHGATVILLDSNLRGLEQLHDEIVASGATPPALYPIDFSGATEDDYFELASVLEREFNCLHGLLHNATAFATPGPVTSLPTADWIRVINVNLNAPWLLTRVLMPVLQKAPAASVVFTSDSAARQGNAYWGAYAVSKIAVEGLAAILADELESAARVRVNILVPGPVDTPIRKRAFPAESREHLACPQSLQQIYLYLFSDRSQGKTGQTFSAEDFNP